MPADADAAVEGILQQIREREHKARRRAVVLTVVPVVMAGALLAFTALTMAKSRKEKEELEVQKGQLDTLIQQHRTKLDSLLKQIADVHVQLDSAKAALVTAQSELEIQRC